MEPYTKKKPSAIIYVNLIDRPSYVLEALTLSSMSPSSVISAIFSRIWVRVAIPVPSIIGASLPTTILKQVLTDILAKFAVSKKLGELWAASSTFRICRGQLSSSENKGKKKPCSQHRPVSFVLFTSVSLIPKNNMGHLETIDIKFLHPLLYREAAKILPSTFYYHPQHTLRTPKVCLGSLFRSYL